MSVLIRLLEKNELHLANDFFNSIYKTNRSIDDFEWEFVSGPAGPAIYVIAVDDTISDRVKVVGIQCAIPIELMNAQGQTILSAKSEDTLVDPSYRGQKIFERMYDLLFSECQKAAIAYIWGFTPAKKAFERIQFEIPFQAHQAVMVLNPTKAYKYLSSLNPENKLKDKLKIAGLAALSYIKTLGLRRLTEVTLLPISIRSKVDVIEKFYSNTGYQFLHLTDTYLNWRIERNPFGNSYENYRCFQGEHLIADILVNYRPGRLGYIEQMMFSPELNDVNRQDIIKSIVAKMKSRVDLIRVLCFDINPELKRQEKTLDECGFVVLKRGAHFVWRSFAADALNPSQLFLSRLFTQGNQ